MVTHGREKIERLSQHIEWFNSFGVFVFLLFGSLGIFFGSSFLTNLTPNSMVTLIFLDVIIAMKVFAGIVVLAIFFFEQGVVEC